MHKKKHKSRVMVPLLGLATLAFVSRGFAASEKDVLPALGAKLNTVTVSGISSGAYMATQFHVAFSDTVQGVGIVAGGPYHCAAQDPSMGMLPQVYANAWTAFYPQVYVNLMVASVYCFNAVQLPDLFGLSYMNDLSLYPMTPNADLLVKEAGTMASSGKIDGLNNLADDRVYLFSGQNDHVVPTNVVSATKAFYLKAGVKTENMAYVDGSPAGHSYVVDGRYCDPLKKQEQGGCVNETCQSEAMPYINDCQYNQAQAIMSHLYGSGLRAPTDNGGTDDLQAKPFSQVEYFSSTSDFDDSLMAKTGYVYIPKQCEAKNHACQIHVAFHGCEQGAENYVKKGYGENMFFDHVGYNEIARANDLVILYPQVNAGEGNLFKTQGYNPKGCWDWWGYTNKDFDTKTGLQAAAVMKMVRRLAAEP